MVASSLWSYGGAFSLRTTVIEVLSEYGGHTLQDVVICFVQHVLKMNTYAHFDRACAVERLMTSALYGSGIPTRRAKRF